MGNYNTSVLEEVSRPGIFDKAIQHALIGSGVFYNLIAGKYEGENKSKVSPALVESTDVGNGYFENFVLLKENDNITWRDATEGLTNTTLDLGDRPRVAIQNLVGTIPLFQRDLDLNTQNPDKVQDLLSTAIIQAKDTVTNRMNIATFALGTEFATKTLWGLRYWIPDSATTGSVAGISQVTETNWRTYSLNAGVNSFATNAEAYFETMFLETNFNGNMADLVIMDNTSYGRFKALIKARELYNPIDDKATRLAGFEGIRYSGRYIIPDANCPAGSVFAVNTKKIKLATVKGCNMRIGEFIEPVGEQFKSAKFTWRGNIVFLTRKSNGKIYGFTTP